MTCDKLNDSKKTVDITILCKVVDNFGDIGVVYRLARALSDLSVEKQIFSIRIVVDNLKSFSLLEPEINPELDFQTVHGWQIFQWDADEKNFNAFSQNHPEIIFECFQCGRPDFLERLLFDVKIPETVHIIMIDYLTAEDYAESFHKLMSLTRSSRVQKVNFMPGFTEKTGGLILDKPFLKALNSRGASLPLSSNKVEVSAGSTTTLFSATPSPKGSALKNLKDNAFNAVFFSYPKDWSPAINAFSAFNQKKTSGKLQVLLAKGAGFESFEKAFESCKTVSGREPFTLYNLPFLPQTEWDALLCRTPLLFIRGEDSLSRACLCGVPFVWHAYPQSEEYQLVKVQALLDRMRRHFSPELFEKVEKCWQVYNKTDSNNEELEAVITDFLMNYDELKQGFAEFSESLLKNGDLAEHLVQFIYERIGEK